jgi:hypothetical protein
MICTKCQQHIRPKQPYHRTKRGPHHQDCVGGTFDKAGWFAIKAKVFLEKFPEAWLTRDPFVCDTVIETKWIADLMRAAKREGIAFDD